MGSNAVSMAFPPVMVRVSAELVNILTSPIDVSTCLTLTEVEYEMREVTAADWFPLGVQLGIRPAKLREIEKDHPGDVWRCKFELLDWWHRNAKEVSWNALARTFEKMGGYGALGQKLRPEKVCKR